jgi:hypothetical protein
LISASISFWAGWTLATDLLCLNPFRTLRAINPSS